MDSEEEYLRILDLLYRVVEAAKETAQTREILRDTEGLARKFFLHCSSILYLGRGTKIPDFQSLVVSFFDPASLNVLVRAALEAFLTFHYIFGGSISQAERDLRYYSWWICGLKERADFPYSVPHAKKVLENDSKCISQYAQTLQANEVFAGLSRKEQKSILEGKRGVWKRDSWRKIALDAGLSELHARHFYSYVCGYAHSSSLSTLQLQQAFTAQRQRMLIETSMDVTKIAMSYFVFEYCQVFPQSTTELEKDSEARAVAELWYGVGRGLQEADTETHND